MIELSDLRIFYSVDTYFGYLALHFCQQLYICIGVLSHLQFCVILTITVNTNFMLHDSCYIYMQISGASRNNSLPCLGSTSKVGHPCIVAVKLCALVEGCTTETCMPAYWFWVSLGVWGFP